MSGAGAVVTSYLEGRPRGIVPRFRRGHKRIHGHHRGRLDGVAATRAYIIRSYP